MTSTQEQQEAANVARRRKEYPKFRWLGTWSSREKRIRLLRVVFMRGLGPGYGAPDHYSAKFSIAIEWKLPDLWIGAFWKAGRDEWTLWLCLIPCVPIRLHYLRSYGGFIT